MITNKPSPKTKKSWKAMKEKILAKNKTFHLTDLSRYYKQIKTDKTITTLNGLELSLCH